MFIIKSLLLLLIIKNSQQQLISMKNGNFLAMRAAFKGIPELPEINKFIGEKRAVYFYDQLVAIVDVSGKNKLQRCELVEVYEPDQFDQVLTNLSTSYKPTAVTFNDISRLMLKCDRLDDIKTDANDTKVYNQIGVSSLFANPLFSIIVPGTKWCGTGDVAKNYHDLGPYRDIDRCCRAHDLCPVKIRGYRSLYNLYNKSFYTKSHCNCDNAFYECLKNVNLAVGNFIGTFYFNLVKPECINDEDDNGGRTDGNKKFVTPNKTY